MSEVHVCPWWIGYLMAHPLRKLFQNPYKLLGKYIKKGDNVLEIGPGMGFFTLPAAGLTGPKGKVITVDVQERMLKSLMKRAVKKKLNSIIDARLSDSNSFNIKDLNNKIDFCLLMYVVHELPDKQMLFNELGNAIRKNGVVLVSEPPGHVTQTEFEESITLLESAGFKVTSTPNIKRSLSAELIKV
jgi:ubiquinone/menaquinone biosynthesis C-methylase UbiE